MGYGKKKTETENVEVPELSVQEANLRLVGLSPLVVHAWSEKARKEMRDKQMKVAKGKREAKDPNREFEGARYRIPKSEYDGFPAGGIKSAIVDACSYVDGITKVAASGGLHVNLGEPLVPIQAANGKRPVTPTMREDLVRVGGKGKGTGTADLRYRPEYTEWSIPIKVRFNPRIISIAQIVNLLNHAGFSIGLGEMRPQKMGQYGMFECQADNG
jgi:hypothetical protein